MNGKREAHVLSYQLEKDENQVNEKGETVGYKLVPKNLTIDVSKFDDKLSGFNSKALRGAFSYHLDHEPTIGSALERAVADVAINRGDVIEKRSGLSTTSLNSSDTSIEYYVTNTSSSSHWSMNKYRFYADGGYTEKEVKEAFRQAEDEWRAGASRTGIVDYINDRTNNILRYNKGKKNNFPIVSG